MNDYTMIWLAAFIIIYWFIYRKPLNIHKLIGAAMLTLNGLAGVIIGDSIITYFIFTITFINLMREIVIVAGWTVR